MVGHDMRVAGIRNVRRPGSGAKGASTVIAHDSVTGLGGAERVLDAMFGMWPRAPLYTAVYRPAFQFASGEACAVHVSPLQRIPLPLQFLKPLFPWAFERFRLPPGVRLVLSSSSGYAKGIRSGGGAVHVSYVHTPLRRVWNPYHRAARRTAGGPPGRALEKVALAYLRRWDLASMARVDHIVVNSRNTAEQVRRIYGRETTVVHPPVRTEFFTPCSNGPGDYYLVVSRLDPYKRVDLAVRAAVGLGVRLVVVGDGVERRRLERLAGESATFTGVVDDERLRALYRGCRALLFPGEEDFGVAPVEAQACGRPVVAFGAGGALETVVDGETGILFSEQTQPALEAAIARFQCTRFDLAHIRAHALQFAEAAFRESLEALVRRALPVLA